MRLLVSGGRYAALAVLSAFVVSCSEQPLESEVGAPQADSPPTLVVAPTSTPSIVISQVYGGGGNSGAPLTHDFVELFNRGDAPVDVEGWSVQYASAMGTTWLVTPIPASGSTVIPPGGYFLVQLAGGATGVPLPAPDAIGGTNMAAGSGKLVLAAPGATVSGVCPEGTGIADRVSYGTTNCGELWGTTQILSNTTAALRLADGCTHTGNVTADFARAAPNPRNSATPAAPCPPPPAEPASVTVSPAEATVFVGMGRTFTAAAVDADGTPVPSTFTWSSDDESVLTIGLATGAAFGVSAGTTVVTATAPNGVTGTATVTVAAAPAPGTVVISQVYGGGGNSGATFNRDYVELLNRGQEPIDVGGWGVHYTSANGTSWSSNVTVLGAGPGSTVLPPGGYYLVALAGGVNGADLPGLDDSGATNMSAASGKLVLALPGAVLSGECPDAPTIVDRVSYGSTNCADAWGATLVLTNTTAALRHDDGCAYSASVSADFARGPPAPRTSGSAANPCAPAGAEPVTVTVSPNPTTIAVGRTRQFLAVLHDAEARRVSAPVSWSSGDATIAGIDPGGLATGVAPGVTTVTATAANGAHGSADLTVTEFPEVGSIVLAMNDPRELPVGYTKPVFPTVRDEENIVVSPAPPLAYTSSNPGVATVDDRGYVDAHGVGTTTIRATALNGVQSNGVVLTVLPHSAPTGAVYRNHLELGMPFDADPSDDFLVQRPQFTTSWNSVRGGPNWVAWNINTTHFGAVDRCNCFTSEPQLPAHFYQVHDFDYRNSGYDRGHMVMSASRTTTMQENAATFFFSNILPQASNNNSGPWLGFEIHNNDAARLAGKELYVVAGGEYGPITRTLKDEGNVHIPDYTWKITVLLEAGQGLDDIRSPDDLQVIAVRMPNLVGVPGPASADDIRNHPWEMYRTTVASIEAATGYTFLSALPQWIQPIVKNDDSRPVAGAGGPYTTTAGASVSFDGSASFDPDPDDVLTFHWHFGDGGTATGVQPTYSYDMPGAYTAMLVVVDRWGWADTAYAAVAVAEPAPVPGSVAGAAGFDVPAGALPASPTVDGRAQLAVTARRLPDGRLQGNLELHVNGAQLRFSAGELAWMTIEPGLAQLAGEGELRGHAGIHRFRLRVEEHDGRTHVRMRVLDPAGNVVFDHLPGAPIEQTAPAQPGNVRIRT